MDQYIFCSIQLAQRLVCNITNMSSLLLCNCLYFCFDMGGTNQQYGLSRVFAACRTLIRYIANKNGFSREKLSRWHCLQPTFRTSRVQSASKRMRRVTVKVNGVSESAPARSCGRFAPDLIARSVVRTRKPAICRPVTLWRKVYYKANITVGCILMSVQNYVPALVLFCGVIGFCISLSSIVIV